MFSQFIKRGTDHIQDKDSYLCPLAALIFLEATDLCRVLQISSLAFVRSVFGDFGLDLWSWTSRILDLMILDHS